jgi:hypothetical protein
VGIRLKVSLKKLQDSFSTENAALRRALGNGLESAAHRTVALMHERTKTAPPASKNGTPGAVNTGFYKRSWRSQRIVRVGKIASAVVFNTASYAGIIDLGRRKGGRMPPIEPIARWVQRKLNGALRPRKVAAKAPTRRIPPVPKDPAKHAAHAARTAASAGRAAQDAKIRATAYAIARAIVRRGLRARRVMSGLDALEKMGDFAVQEVRRALKRERLI